MGAVRTGVYKHHSGKMYRARCVAKHTPYREEGYMSTISTNWLVVSLKQCADSNRCRGCAMYKRVVPELCRSTLMRMVAERLEGLSNDSN